MSPTRLDRPSRSRSPVVRAITAPTSGTAAMSSAVNELEMCCSAVPSKTHGIAISIAANTSSGTQWPFNGRSSPRAAAMGNSSSAAIVVRPSTSTAGLRSRTATRIRRYGMPQITDIAANRSSPRLVTVQRYGLPRGLRQQDSE